jgi:hypothetical protein
MPTIGHLHHHKPGTEAGRLTGSEQRLICLPSPLHMRPFQGKSSGMSLPFWRHFSTANPADEVFGRHNSLRAPSRLRQPLPFGLRHLEAFKARSGPCSRRLSRRLCLHADRVQPWRQRDAIGIAHDGEHDRDGLGPKISSDESSQSVMSPISFGFGLPLRVSPSTGTPKTAPPLIPCG